MAKKVIRKKKRMSAIPLQLVTGFFGSGKTTFLKNYLKEFSGSRRIGIIQNEFSELNVDRVELEQKYSGFEILEVNNGSVFCVCLLGSFVDSLAEFIDQIQPDELILEASGMSDPLYIGQIMQSPKLKQKVYLDRVWCLVDSVNFKKISGLQTRVNHQVRIADTVIINKADLTDPKDEGLENMIKKLNPFASISITSFARVGFELVKPTIKFMPIHEVIEDGRPDLESQVIKSTRLICPDKLDEFLMLLKPGCIRCKGYINIQGNRKVFLQGSFERVTLHEVDFFPSPTEFVAIGNFSEIQSFQKIYDSFCLS